MLSPIGDGGSGADLMIRLSDRTIPIELLVAAVVDESRARTIVDVGRPERAPNERLHVIVADKVTDGAWAMLRSSGWGYLDLRGALYLKFGDALLINDTTIRPSPRTPSMRSAPLASGISLGIALLLLEDPSEPLGVRKAARQLGCSPSSAHAAIAALEGGGACRLGRQTSHPGALRPGGRRMETGANQRRSPSGTRRSRSARCESEGGFERLGAGG